MLPFGHIAAGYLVAKAVLAVAGPSFSSEETHWLILAGMFFAFAPDLDMFYIFWKEKGLYHRGEKFDHRELWTHAPLLWFLAGLIIAVIGQTLFWFSVGAMLWLSSWSHFALDSLSMGVRWFYPFRKKFYALKNPGVKTPNTAIGFFRHWFNLVSLYARQHLPTFLLEVSLILAALLIYLRVSFP